jgi:pimeloyl-ACP methyl ester carboxylesterase
VPPETHYAKSGDVNIAYQVIGSGSLDLVLVPGWVSHVEQAWDEPSFAGFLHRLASFSRLIFLDRRGTGLSDAVAGPSTLEQRMDDVRAVMDAAGSEHAALFGISEGGPMCSLFAATYPERTDALVLYGTMARGMRGADYPWGVDDDQAIRFLEGIEQGWGKGMTPKLFAPSIAQDERQVRSWAKFERMAVSPGGARVLFKILLETDVRAVLPTIQVPTLVMHRTGDRATPVGGGRYIAEQIPGAKYVELDGIDHFPWVGGSVAVLDEVEEFLTGVRHGPEPDRVLATVMFTDIVGSTELAATLGDRRWRAVLDRFYEETRKYLGIFRGREVDTAGDGFFATFDGPARGIRCALAIRDALTDLEISIRAGLHTGECEVLGDKVSGIAVHLGARVASRAEANEVLVSTTVKDLVAGSGLEFVDRGAHTLKGIPGEWRLFAASEGAAE